MSLYHRTPSTSFATEFDILKASHKFLREGQDAASWNDQLAQKYYDTLFREFAVCDLKHYKSGNFALRWRTEAEVLSGAGENTCGNTRCERHHDQDPAVKLNTLELPFVYEEHGERKSALVKVVLCPRCLKKLMWKRNKEKESQATTSSEVPVEGDTIPDEVGDAKRSRRPKESRDKGSGLSRHRPNSRSRSPRHRRDNHGSHRRRSRSL